MTTMNANPSESIYDKLNNVHASLRRQKEDSYRSRNLAEERLRLARQDREALERKGNQTRAQLEQLKEQAVEMKGANAVMETGNIQLEKEFNFQHSELQGKKEKLFRLEEKRNNEASSRHHSVSAAREMLRRLRENSSQNEDDPSFERTSPDQKRCQLEQAMEIDGGEALCVGLPELLQLRRTLTADAAKHLETRNASLRRIVAGYQNALDVGVMESPQQSVRQEAVPQQ